jgi:CheY-like chemotaxis protein
MKFSSITLELEGYQIFQACDGDEGLKLAKETHFDLILLDLMLPVMDGWTVFEQMKNDPELSVIPIVVFSAAVEQANQDKAVEMGAADFLLKPLTAGELRDTVKKLLPN